MKSVRKPLIISLAFVLLLSAANTTAFAAEAGTGDAGSIRLANPVILVEPGVVTPAVTTVVGTPAETAPAQPVQDDDAATASTVSSGTLASATDVPAAAASVTTTSASDNKATSAPTQTPSPEQSSSASNQAVDDADAQTVHNITDIVPKASLTAGQEIAITALKYNGYKYVYGAASPSVGFDCSGFAYYICKQSGITLPRTAHLQYRSGTAVEKSDLQPGDLVFFATYGGHSVTHVGVYIGNNQFIHAATTRQGVIISSLDNSYWSNAWVGAKRMVSQQVSLALA